MDFLHDSPAAAPIGRGVAALSEARCRGCLGILTPDQGEYHHGTVILVPSNRKRWICWMAYMYHPMDKNHVPSINHVRFRFFEAGSV